MNMRLKLLKKMSLFENYKINLILIFLWIQEETQNKLRTFIIVLNKNLKQKKSFVSIFVLWSLFFK
jgi:predicted DNA-binding antitoxin AbrB/MazE fold protein